MKFDFITPTKEQAVNRGIADITALMKSIASWTSGIAFGLDAVDSAIVFRVVRVTESRIMVETDSWPLIGTIMGHLEQYGFTCQQVFNI